MEADGQPVSAGARVALAALRSEIGALRGLGAAKSIDGANRADFSRFHARPGIARALRETGEMLRVLGGDALDAAAAAERLHSAESEHISRRTRWADPAAPAVDATGDTGVARAEFRAAPWWTGARPVSVSDGGRVSVSDSRAEFSQRDCVPVATAATAAPTATAATTAPALNAIVLPADLSDPAEIAARITTTNLYYVPAWDHFAFCINGVLFHAGVGEVGAPATECRFRRPAGCPRRDSDSRRRCPAYHDPAEFPGSQEIRGVHSETDRFGLADICAGRLVAEKNPQRRARRDIAAHDVLVALLSAAPDAAQGAAQSAA